MRRRACLKYITLIFPVGCPSPSRDGTDILRSFLSLLIFPVSQGLYFFFLLLSIAEVTFMNA